jgi:uncharacterized lipoprotein YajG
MNTLTSSLKSIVGPALIAGVFLLNGCSATVMPRDIPPIKGLETGSLAGFSLGIKNAETGSTEYAILNSSGQVGGFVTNRQAWSRKLVEALAGELSRRGAQVRVNAPLTIGIALPEITFSQDRGILQFKVKVAVSSSTGWSKTYEAAAESDPGPFELLDATANRVSGQVLVEAIKAILGDAEFLAQLRKK